MKSDDQNERFAIIPSKTPSFTLFMKAGNIWRHFSTAMETAVPTNLIQQYRPALQGWESRSSAV